MKHTKQQIGEQICRWTAYLLENKMATKEEIDHILDESLFKQAKAAIKGGASKIGSGISNFVKGTARAIHDYFAPNPGVKELMKNINYLMKDKKYDAEDIKLYVFIKELKDTFPVADFSLSKDKKKLVLMFKDKNTKPKTYVDLHDFLRDAGLTGSKVKLSDYVDSLVVGQIEDDMVLESVKSYYVARINKVIKALGWSKKYALDPKSLNKIVALFGIQGKNAVDQVKDVVKSYFDTQSSSENSKKSKHDDSDEPEDKDSKDADEEEVDFKKNKDKHVNDTTLETKAGEIGVMTCPFKQVRTQNNKIGIIFGNKTSTEKHKKDMEELVK